MATSVQIPVDEYLHTSYTPIYVDLPALFERLYKTNSPG